MLSDSAEPGIAEAIGRAKPVRWLQSGVVDGFRAALKFVVGFLGRAEEEIRVSLRVIADEVAARNDFFYQRGALLNKSPYQEERGLRVVFGEKIEKFWSDSGVRTVVKCQCE